MTRETPRTRSLAGRFALVGVFNTLVDYISFNLFFYAGLLDLLPAHLLSASIAIAGSFLMNRSWTFAHVKHQPWGPQLLRHLATTGSSLVLTSIVIWFAAFYLPAYLAKVVAIGISFAWNFSLSRHWVFRERA